MAKGYFICRGDKTYCGGEVLEGHTGITWHGLLHSHEGDRVSCGKDGKTYRILGGVSHFTSDGKRVAGTLDSVSGCPCRSQLIPSITTASYIAEDSPTTRTSQGAEPKPAAQKPARFAGPGSCDHPDRMEELASYIADEMNRNINHPSVLEMKELNSYDPVAETREYMALPFYKRLGSQPDFHAFALAKQARAFALWAERVGQDRPWDHKPKIKSRYGDYWHKQGNYDYYYDIWSNIHYGYVGIIAGLSESILLDGAGVEQIISDTYRKIEEVATEPKEKWIRPGPRPTATPWTTLRSWDDVADRVSISIGIKIAYVTPNGGVTKKQIMNEVLAVSPENWGDGVTTHDCR
ncbi:polymorphic toxin type 44 domain-containing protein [Pseudomonas syringae]|uniref:polymorphic toxin type 44 domain-containing protein n=1 Tax=Pseudomonas syringae TaxID=317 RepID=UPI0009B0AC2E|nr:polymorphic toxin type 44 domain-containing protein [Pseudomonas syringae]